MSCRFPAVAGLLLVLIAPAPGQSSGHLLVGQLVVDETEGGPMPPRTFQIVLRSLSQVIIGRETVAANGHYRFLGLGNGEYTLGVELEGRELARVTVTIFSAQDSRFRRDITLAWKKVAAEDLKAEVVYARSAAQQDLFDKALAEIEAGNDVRARLLLEQVLLLDPEDYEAWTELGTVLFRGDDLEEAEKAYARALDSHPDYLLALLNLGKLCMAQKRYHGAIEVLRRALRKGDPLAEAFYHLGEAHLQIRKGSLAVAYFERALKIDPQGMADAHLRLARLYQAAGYTERAVRELEQYLAKRPDTPRRAEIEKFIRDNRRAPATP